MKVPDKVKEAAKNLIDRYGGSVEYLGRHNDADFYVLSLPDYVTIGFPYVYQYASDSVLAITGFEALDIINLFVKDVDEIDVE